MNPIGPHASDVCREPSSAGPWSASAAVAQAEARRDERPADARVVHQGPADRPAPGAEAEVPRAAAPVQEVRQVRAGDQRDLPAHRPRSPTTSASSARCTPRQINHDPAHTFMNTGTTICGRPSMGSWVTYGLGSEADEPARLRRADLDGARRQHAADRPRQWHSGFLPSQFQGVQFRSKGDPVLTSTTRRASPRRPARRRGRRGRRAQPARNDSRATTRRSPRGSPVRDGVPDADERAGADGHLEGAEATLDLYGAKPATGPFAANCLLARRLAERGVRFIQLYHRDWDHHGNVKNGTSSSRPRKWTDRRRRR